MSAFNPTLALDLLAQSNLAVLAAVPAGLVGANLKGDILKPVLERIPRENILKTLHLSSGRLEAELEACGSLSEALALIIDERIRAGRMLFDDLLINYAVPDAAGIFQRRFIWVPSAMTGAEVMLQAVRALVIEPDGGHDARN